MAELPVACRLSAPELRARESGLLESVASRVLERTTIPPGPLGEGLRLRFAPGTEVLQEIAELIALERQCCPFLRFTLDVEPADGPVWLELVGPAGTADFLATLPLGRAGAATA